MLTLKHHFVSFLLVLVHLEPNCAFGDIENDPRWWKQDGGYVIFKTRAAVFYRDLKPCGAAE